jgi:hypothetical protein
VAPTRSGREGGLHAGRLPGQQRIHLAAVLTLLLSVVAPLGAQEIEFDPTITQQEFQKFSRIVAQGIYASPVQAPGASGLLRFDIGIAATLVEIDENELYWQHAVGEDFSVGGNYVGVPRLVVSKGLGGAAIAGSYAKISDTGVTILGGAIDIPIINGGLVKPTLALRGTYSMLQGLDEFDQKVYGVELFLAKGFGPVTPYGGVGKMRSDSRGIIPATSVTPAITLEDESDIMRYTVGVRITMLLPKLVVEATQAEERSYSAKISIGF